MLASPKDPSVFRCRSPVGAKRKSHLLAKGTSKLELGGRFLMFRDQILKHLGSAYLILRFGSENKKVDGGDSGCKKNHPGVKRNFFFRLGSTATPMKLLPLHSSFVSWVSSVRGIFEK